VADLELSQQILDRAALAGAAVPADLAARLVAYLELLRRWNRTINLTALPLEPATDEAIDRLIVEPIVAAAHLRPGDHLVIDIGSGGGSPAIPMKLAAPSSQFVLVEAKTRKAAFLRAAVQELQLAGVTIENCRAEEFAARHAPVHMADVLTLRAVRVDEMMEATVVALLKPAGRFFWFGGPIEGPSTFGARPVESRHQTLLPGVGITVVNILGGSI